MKVYVIVGFVRYEGQQNYGVFLDKKEAEKECKRLAKEHEFIDGFYPEEFEVQ